MGVLKNVLSSTLAYAEEKTGVKEVPKFVSSIRNSVPKPCDSILTQVETLLTTHGPQILDKVDGQVDMLQEKAKETYGEGIKRTTEVVEYAKETKDGVVNYALDKKTAVYDTATKTTETAKNTARDLVCQVQSGELKEKLMKIAEKQPVAASMATRFFALFAVATAFSENVKSKADVQIASVKGYYNCWCLKARVTAESVLAKLPVAAAQEMVANGEKQVRAYVLLAKNAAKSYVEMAQAKAAPFMEQMKPYLSFDKLKAEASKVYMKLMEYKTTFTKKQA